MIVYVDLLGVFIGALSGALVACRKHDFDYIGVGALALCSGVGGGLLRDTFLQQGPPLALRGHGYLLATGVGAAIGFFWGRKIVESRVLKLITWIDAFTLGNFAVAGTVLAHNAGLSWPACILIGVINASGGGIIRDTLAGDRVGLFVRGELYATAAAAGAAIVLITERFLPNVAAGLLGWAVAVGVRALAIIFGWKAPLPPGRVTG